MARYSPSDDADGLAQRPADPAVRRANVQRALRLFVPYKARLSAVAALIFVSAGAGVVSPFLLRDILDDALPNRDSTQLTLLVLGMIGIAVLTGVVGVYQTLLSNQVGQRVMHRLRSDLFAHLQRQSLGFFTRTRGGEVQSRLVNDIGSMQGVVTQTATSIAASSERTARSKALLAERRFPAP